MKLHKIARNCDIAFAAKKPFCQMKIVFCIARKIDLPQSVVPDRGLCSVVRVHRSVGGRSGELLACFKPLF